MNRPIVGITMGDAAGIGPEVILKALLRHDVRTAARCLVYGSPAVMQQTANSIGWPGRVLAVSGPEACAYPMDGIEVLACGELPPASYTVGAVSAACGDLAFRSIRRAIADAMAGFISATATAPVNKASMNLAGHHFAGHTEIYAHFTGTTDYTMMLVDGGLRVAHVSTHVSLREAIECVKRQRILTVIGLVRTALLGMGITAPRIAVAGLNPHAGENGLFGREEIDEIAPAVAAARLLGASGPYPPDSVFSRAAGGEFDAVVAMYHDQGHIPLKMAGFRFGGAAGTSIQGINITLGTPVIRCSVDHGTAFPIAGMNQADPVSMAAAIVAAAGMAIAGMSMAGMSMAGAATTGTVVAGTTVAGPAVATDAGPAWPDPGRSNQV
jgi:4-hydroxythreonine-4-phosphate dehydrogenase